MGEHVGGGEMVGLAGGWQSSGPRLIPANLVGSQGRRSHIWDPGGFQALWTSVAEKAGAGRHGDISQDREEQGRSLFGEQDSNWSLGVSGTRVEGRVRMSWLFLGHVPLWPDQVRGCDIWL